MRINNLFISGLAVVAASLMVGLPACDDSPDDVTSSAEALTSNGVTATLALTADWQDGYTAKVTFSNSNAVAITSWQVTIALNQSTVSSGPWECASSINGSTLTMSPNGGSSIPVGNESFFCSFNGSHPGGTHNHPTLATLTVNGGTGAGGASGSTGRGGTTGAAGRGGTTGAAGRGGTTGMAGRGGTTGSAGTTGSGAGGSAGGTASGGNGFYRMERLNRGLVAVQQTNGVYVGWRMFGFEPSNVSYKVYRGATNIRTVTDSTNFLDSSGTSSSTYTVRPVIGGVEGASSETASVWTQNYLRVPLQIPPGGTTPGAPTCEIPNEAYTYSANDASVGDVDGDGRYEIILKWDPSNAKDNSQSGCTGNVFIDAYRLDGTRLWRIDLGRNIRAGAHYTQFIVYDFDNDGRAEMAVKTAPGTKDGTGQFLHTGPAANDNDNDDYRSVANAAGRTGYILTGAEYLTVFDGQTGAERATVAFDVPRGTVSAWGDNYGNRVDRFLATAAYLDGTGMASFVMARGYYTRSTLTAWNFRNNQITPLWKFDSNVSGSQYAGQGAHSLSVANVDGDNGQEIIYGAMTVDDNGAGKCSSGNKHGDALHVGDFNPSRPGIEVFMCNEDGTRPAHYVRDAATCAVLQAGPTNGADTGRCVADDILASNPGAEMWSSSVTGLFSASTNANLGTKPSSQNFLIWWDADETRELEDGTAITKYSPAGTLQSCSACASNNGTKSTPALTADLYGDWREEIIWRESNNAALRIYTTTNVTTRRIFTLMHDPQYRVAVSWQNVAYNQPPHPSFHIGSGMATPAAPNITVR
jgi:rhamnogalacturonan endolyase